MPLEKRIRVRDTDEVIVVNESQDAEVNVPQSLKDKIDTGVLLPVSGDATKENPLVLQVADNATVESIKKLIDGYEVIVTIANARQEITYNLILKNAQDTHYLSLMVSQVILKSLII